MPLERKVEDREDLRLLLLEVSEDRWLEVAPSEELGMELLKYRCSENTAVQATVLVIPVTSTFIPSHPWHWAICTLAIPGTGLFAPWLSLALGYLHPGYPWHWTICTLAIPSTGLFAPWLSLALDYLHPGYPWHWAICTLAIPGTGLFAPWLSLAQDTWATCWTPVISPPTHPFPIMTLKEQI